MLVRFVPRGQGKSGKMTEIKSGKFREFKLSWLVGTLLYQFYSCWIVGFFLDWIKYIPILSSTHCNLQCFPLFLVPSSQAYTSKRLILIQVLPPPNVYTKSANACTVNLQMIACVKIYHLQVYSACISRFGIRIGRRKYLNQYTPFGSVSLWVQCMHSAHCSLQCVRWVCIIPYWSTIPIDCHSVLISILPYTPMIALTSRKLPTEHIIT